jgi:hypothetical protein
LGARRGITVDFHLLIAVINNFTVGTPMAGVWAKFVMDGQDFNVDPRFIVALAASSLAGVYWWRHKRSGKVSLPKRLEGVIGITHVG